MVRGGVYYLSVEEDRDLTGLALTDARLVRAEGKPCM